MLCRVFDFTPGHLEKSSAFNQQDSHHLNLYMDELDKNKLNFNSGLCTAQSHPMLPNDLCTQPAPPQYGAVISLCTLSHFQRNTVNPCNYSISLLSSNSSYCLWRLALQSTLSLPPPPPCIALFLRLRAVTELFWLLSDVHNMLTPVHRSNTKRCFVPIRC